MILLFRLLALANLLVGAVLAMGGDRERGTYSLTLGCFLLLMAVSSQLDDVKKELDK